MAIELRMPALSPTMEAGTLAKWLVKPGDVVKAGNLVAEVETDKATLEIEAVEGGRIVKLLVPEESDDIAVGTVIAILVDDQIIPAPIMAEVTGLSEKELPAEPQFAASRQIVAPKRDILSDPSRGKGANATPLTRRIATAKDIELAEISGSGPYGMILKADLGLPPIIPPWPTVHTASAIVVPPAEASVGTAFSGSTQKISPRRRNESEQQPSHFYLTTRCYTDRLLMLQAELNAELYAREIEISITDMLMKALALTLKSVPDAHVAYGGDILHRFDRVDISMTVQSDHGPIAPVIRGVETLSLSAIALAVKTSKAKVCEGKLLPEDCEGGSISLVSPGTYAIDEIFPVIDPPRGLTLGIGAGIRQPWNVGGELALAIVTAATAVFDHGAINGATAAEFMETLRQHIENPLLLIS